MAFGPIATPVEAACARRVITCGGGHFTVGGFGRFTLAAQPQGDGT
jgi:hypothetical protein